MMEEDESENCPECGREAIEDYEDSPAHYAAEDYRDSDGALTMYGYMCTICLGFYCHRCSNCDSGVGHEHLKACGVCEDMVCEDCRTEIDGKIVCKECTEKQNCQ